MLHQAPGPRCIRLALILGAVFTPAFAAASEVSVIERLLELPTHADSLAEWSEPPPLLSLEPGAPGSDLAVLAYWGERLDKEEPSTKARRRLLEAALQHPDWIPEVLDRLPQDPETFDRVKLLYDSAPAQHWYSEHWAETVAEWLMLNSEHLREELVETASHARDDENGSVENATELTALARLDWDAAAPILARLAEGREVRTKTLALSLQYRHLSSSANPSEADEFRTVLQAITLDPSAPGYSRDTAAEALLETEWDGRDEWYLALFADSSLMRMSDGYYLRSPLNTPIRADPDRWIPVVSSLVGSEDRAVHDNAVSVLIRFQLDDARADALRPLLPWLFDPEWSSAAERLRLIQSVDQVGLREAIPGLIHIVDTDGVDADWAADALAAFKVPDAAPALQKLLSKEADAMERRRVIKALLACEGLSVEEMVAALHTYCAQVASEEGRKAYDEYRFPGGGEAPLPVEVSIGAELSREDFEPSETLVGALIDSLGSFETRNPDAAVILRRIMAQWSSPRLDRLFLQELAAGKAEAEVISSALARRHEIRDQAAVAWSQLLGHGGLALGITAVLLEDQVAALGVLDNGDPAAKGALLGAARLVGSRLPVDNVVPLLSSNDVLVSQAAERYLEAHDSREAREALWRHHEGQARILGSRPPYDPGHATFGVFDELEDELREEILANHGPDEIYALLSAGYWGGVGQRIIRVRDGRARLECDGRRRPLTRDELRGLLDFIAENEIDDLGRLDTATADGVQFEYLHLTPRGGRRVFMNNPGTAGGSVYDVLTSLFLNLECS